MATKSTTRGRGRAKKAAPKAETPAVEESTPVTDEVETPDTEVAEGSTDTVEETTESTSEENTAPAEDDTPAVDEADSKPSEDEDTPPADDPTPVIEDPVPVVTPPADEPESSDEPSMCEVAASFGSAWKPFYGPIVRFGANGIPTEEEHYEMSGSIIRLFDMKGPLLEEHFPQVMRLLRMSPALGGGLDKKQLIMNMPTNHAQRRRLGFYEEMLVALYTLINDEEFKPTSSTKVSISNILGRRLGAEVTEQVMAVLNKTYGK